MTKPKTGDPISFTSYNGERHWGTFIGEHSDGNQPLFLVAVPDLARLIKVAATACVQLPRNHER